MPILRTSIQPVMVVPMLAPMMTPMAWRRAMKPLLTSPTTITVVTELDWTQQVTKVPTVQAISRLSVTALIILRKRSPATACMPSDMFFMPSRKMPSPPTTVNRI